MPKSISLRAVTAASLAALFLSGIALAQNSLLYRNAEYRFAILFPGDPEARDVTFTTNDGESVPARQFYVEDDTGHYFVTVVNVAGGPAIDDDLVEHAAEQLRQRGKIRFQFRNNYDPGVPGRQLNILEESGRQLLASVYMWDHHLVVTEASTTPGAPPALQFEQSITLLDADGKDLDTGRGN